MSLTNNNELDYLYYKSIQNDKEYKDLQLNKEIEIQKYLTEMEEFGFDDQHEYEAYLSYKTFKTIISVIGLILIITLLIWI